MRGLLRGLEQAQGSDTLAAELDAVRRRALPQECHPERFERPEEERLAGGEIADAEFDVVEHEISYGRGRRGPRARRPYSTSSVYVTACSMEGNAPPNSTVCRPLASGRSIT